MNDGQIIFDVKLDAESLEKDFAAVDKILTEKLGKTAVEANKLLASIGAGLVSENVAVMENTATNTATATEKSVADSASRTTSQNNAVVNSTAYSSTNVATGGDVTVKLDGKVIANETMSSLRDKSRITGNKNIRY
ncbi:MAG: hypothetical protein LBN40_05685 [Oscillospiraceae bacterium]|jgi:hypothetical protein|nr:hypothetical protein [Oscillospiraceae bacterium]